MAIHYGPSSLVNTKFQAAAANLTIGMRVLPHVFVRAANAQPVEIHDLLPADSRFKILVFAGDLAREEDKARLRTLAEELDKPENFLRRYGRGAVGAWELFDVLCFSSSKQDNVDYLGNSISPMITTSLLDGSACVDFPELFRPHYSM